MNKDAALTQRVNFVGFFDCVGNPNGDPDNDNAPRIDPVTDRCMVTNNCIKRKIRNYIDYTKNGEKGYDIYVRRGTPLDTHEEEAIIATGADKILAAKNPDMSKIGTSVRDYLCDKFYDIRAFGAVLTTLKANNIVGSQLRGPVWISDAWSITPVQSTLITTTRCAPQKKVNVVRNADGEETERQKQGDFGHKYMIPYALFRFNGGINAVDAKTTGFSAQDLELLIEALANSLEYDMSSGRIMHMRKLIVFKHPTELVGAGAQSYVLEDLVQCENVSGSEYPTCFEDYKITVKDAIPKNIQCEIVL